MPSVSLPAAIGIGAGVSGAASLGGSLLSSGAATSAANTQAQAADQATAASQQEAAQTRADLSPFRAAGTTGANALLSTLGLPGGSGQNLLSQNGINSLTFQPTQAQLASTPGYQFDLAQGLQGVANSNAAQGTGISGAALKGAASFATGLANNTLTTQQGIFQSNLGNVLNPLENVANLGENAAAQTGQLGTANVANANSALIGGANASAAGQVGSANAIAGGLSSAGSVPLNTALFNQLLGSSGGAGFVDSGSF